MARFTLLPSTWMKHAEEKSDKNKFKIISMEAGDIKGKNGKDEGEKKRE